MGLSSQQNILICDEHHPPKPSIILGNHPSSLATDPLATPLATRWQRITRVAHTAHTTAAATGTVSPHRRRHHRNCLCPPLTLRVSTLSACPPPGHRYMTIPNATGASCCASCQAAPRACNAWVLTTAADGSVAKDTCFLMEGARGFKPSASRKAQVIDSSAPQIPLVSGSLRITSPVSVPNTPRTHFEPWGKKKKRPDLSHPRPTLAFRVPVPARGAHLCVLRPAPSLSSSRVLMRIVGANFPPKLAGLHADAWY